MLLDRRVGERIMIGDDIMLVVVEVQQHRVRLGIAAPRDVPIFRAEIWLEMQGEVKGDKPVAG